MRHGLSLCAWHVSARLRSVCSPILTGPSHRIIQSFLLTLSRTGGRSGTDSNEKDGWSFEENSHTLPGAAKPVFMLRSVQDLTKKKKKKTVFTDRDHPTHMWKFYLLGTQMPGLESIGENAPHKIP